MRYIFKKINNSCRWDLNVYSKYLEEGKKVLYFYKQNEFNKITCHGVVFTKCDRNVENSLVMGDSFEQLELKLKIKAVELGWDDIIMDFELLFGEFEFKADKAYDI